MLLLASILALLASLPAGLADFRSISYEDLLPTADLFVEENITTYSQLLFDVSRGQVIVGARDVLLRLSVDHLKPLEKALWPSSANKTTLCLTKGQSERDCHNYIKVLLTNGKRIFTCGTNAFSPLCSWRDVEHVNNVAEWVNGVAKCPYSPRSNSTSLLSHNGGHYFSGTATDFSGSDPAIYRTLGGSTAGSPSPPALRTNQYNSKWLNEPQFVGSYETDTFVYFLFRESAVEYINCGKIIYSRIARVCKNDSGGGQLMLKDNWTTFVKARLNCSLPGEYPFYFDEIQGMHYIAEEGLVYATFTTPSNSIPGSAICAFNATAIATAFNGPFKHQETPGSAWERHSTQHRAHFECQQTAAGGQLLDSNRYQLMDLAVQPHTPKPLYTAKLDTFTHITIDVLATKLHLKVHVMYVATADGHVKKISILPRTQETCVVEVWRASPPNNADSHILALRYLKETDSVYVGYEHGLMRVPAQRCSRFKSRQACLNAMDPYCGWNEHKEQCTPAPNRDPLAGYWAQGVTQCPVLTAPVDGGWSTWSAWFPCVSQSSSNSADSQDITPSDTSTVGINGVPSSGPSSNGDQCLCRTRQCNNPEPSNEGSPCRGMSVSVTNCTVHGQWTAWSAWSACSETCGIAVKTRTRMCGNPAPAHGGRVCVGQDRTEIYCASNPPCPETTNIPRDGQWGVWSTWDECSVSCGGGFRTRRRRCDSPPPRDGGQDCTGCHLEYSSCNQHPCPEQKRFTAWTPWLAVQNTSSHNNGWTERRYRFTCRAPVIEQGQIKASLAKEEERQCQSNGQCHRSDRIDNDDVWSEWSPWSPCSVECGGGQQSRIRQCEGRTEQCVGSSHMTRSCNTHRCKAEWGCWSEWSGCSASCDHGIRQRTRHCLNLSNRERISGGCDGQAVQKEPCEGPACHSLHGWEPWTEWSECDHNEEQHRRRHCVTSNPGPDLCRGDDQQTRMCTPDLVNDLAALREHRPQIAGSITVAVVLSCCLAAFCIGLLIAGFISYWYTHRRRPRVPGSPHYITSKQNPYVTVPLKDTAPPLKRASSTSSSKDGGGSGSCTSGNGTTGRNGKHHHHHHHHHHGNGELNTTPKLFSKPADYETATIKRNSHSLANGHIRNDLDQDKFY